MSKTALRNPIARHAQPPSGFMWHCIEPSGSRPNLRYKNGYGKRHSMSCEDLSHRNFVLLPKIFAQRRTLPAKLIISVKSWREIEYLDGIMAQTVAPHPQQNVGWPQHYRGTNIAQFTAPPPLISTAPRSDKCLIVGRPWGQFHGCSMVPICRMIWPGDPSVKQEK